MPLEYKNKIICGDALEVLKTLESESIDMIMTSPPYYGLRDYKVDGQIGLEKTPQLYLEKLWAIFEEVKRVLKKEGTCFVNLGDTYKGGHPGGSTTGGLSKNFKEAIPQETMGRPQNKLDYQEKCLLMVPERFVIGMIERNWILRNHICWFKRNAMPSSVNDRFTCTWEYIYFFSKNRKYYFDLDAIRIPHKEISLQRYQYDYCGKKGDTGQMAVQNESATKFAKKFRNKTDNQSYKLGGMRLCPEPNDPTYKMQKTAEFFKKKGSGGNLHLLNKEKEFYNPKGRNPGDHWDITTKGYKEAHFAVYPEKLCEMPIKAGCPKDGIVLDPFIGAGTTGVVAKKLGRNYIGIELNPKYIEMANKRIQNTMRCLI